MKRFDEPHFLHVVLAGLLTLCLNALLPNKLLSVNSVCFAMLVLSAEDDLDLRMFVITDGNKVRALCIGNETQRSVVAYVEGESLDIECLHSLVIIESRVGLVQIQFLNQEQVALISVAKVKRSCIICSVAENGKNVVSGIELAEMNAPAVFIQPLDVFIEPDILSSDGRYTLALEHYLLDRVLRNEVAP